MMTRPGSRLGELPYCELADVPMAAGATSDRRSTRVHVHLGKSHIENCTICVLCEKISGIFNTKDFMQVGQLGVEFLLDP